MGFSGTSELEDASEVRWFFYIMQETHRKKVERGEEVGRRRVEWVGTRAAVSVLASVLTVGLTEFQALADQVVKTLCRS